MKTVLVCESLSDNVGDQLIGRAAMYLFEQEDPHLHDLSFREIGNGNGNVSKFIFRLRYAVRVLRGAGDLVFCGGQLIHSNNFFYKNIFIWWLAAMLLRIRVTFFCVGCGERFECEERWIYRHILVRSRVVLRDPHSQRNFKRNFPSILACDVATDMAYAFDKLSMLSMSKAPLSADDEKIEMAINPMGRENVLHYISKGESGFLNLGQYDCYLDALAVESSSGVRKIYSTYEDCEEGCQPILLDHVIADVNGSAVLHCARMHVAIIGHILGKDVFTIPVNKKLECSASFFLSYLPSEHQAVLKKSYEKYFTCN